MLFKLILLVVGQQFPPILCNGLYETKTPICGGKSQKVNHRIIYSSDSFKLAESLINEASDCVLYQSSIEDEPNTILCCWQTLC